MTATQPRKRRRKRQPGPIRLYVWGERFTTPKGRTVDMRAEAMLSGRYARPIIYGGEEVGYLRRLSGQYHRDAAPIDQWYGVFGDGGRGTDARTDYLRALNETLAYCDGEIDARERREAQDAERKAKLGALLEHLAECQDIPAVLDYLYETQAIDWMDCRLAYERMLHKLMMNAYERGDYHEMNCIARELAGED